MGKLWVKTINIGFNPSGAAEAARQGNVVMIVDVIDMSTTAETALEKGALKVYGGSPANNQAPVKLNPEKIGYMAGEMAQQKNTKIIIAAEPRIIEKNKNKRRKNIEPVLRGINKTKAKIDKIITNIGKETSELVDFKNKIVIIVSAAGGTAFDAAFNNGSPKVITGTVARTSQMLGNQPAEVAARRAIAEAKKYKSGISIIASSSNSYEDIAAANCICQKILDQGFLSLN